MRSRNQREGRMSGSQNKMPKRGYYPSHSEDAPAFYLHNRRFYQAMSRKQRKAFDRQF